MENAQEKQLKVNEEQQQAPVLQVIRPNARPEEDAIDLLEIGRVLLSKIWILILCFIIGAGGAGVGTKLLVTPMYQSTSMVYIYSKSTSVTSLTDLQIGTQLTVDFQIIATTREVIESVIEELGLNSTYEQLKSQITISNPERSRIIKITVTDADPRRAAVISNALADELRYQVATVMNTDEPSMVERAVAAKNPIGSGASRNAMMGGVALAALVAAFFVVQYLLDDTIKNDEDVRKYLNTTVLAVIPYSEAVDGSNKKGGNTKSSKVRSKK